MNDGAGSADALAALLRGEWPDPDGGAPVGVPVRAVAIERSLRGVEAELVASLRLGRRLAVVSDRDDARGAGRARRARARAVWRRRVGRARRRAARRCADGRASCARACARGRCARRGRVGHDQRPVQVRRGADGKPYVVFATAPSMNGYTSTNAAITVDGHKQSLPAAAPLGVFIDLEVLAAAPARMIRAGLGDSLCRPTAQADWLLSHHLLGTPYRARAVRAAGRRRARAARRARSAAARRSRRRCARWRARSCCPGFGMTICGGSYPGEPGRAPDQPLHRHVRARRARRLFPRRAGGGGDADDGAAAGSGARRRRRRASARRPSTATSCVRRFGDEIGASCWREFDGKRADARSARTG